MWKEKVDSTNNECRRHIDSLDNMSFVAARCQTDGRGQGDHRWTSTPGMNLTFSMVFKHEGRLEARDEVALTHTLTLALLAYLGGKGISARIKWPNDIWVGDKKICGMLIEHSLRADKVDWSIAGIGLNINQTDFPADIPNPTSLKMLTKADYEPAVELETLHKEICRLSPLMYSPDGRKLLQEEFGKKVFRLTEAL